MVNMAQKNQVHLMLPSKSALIQAYLTVEHVQLKPRLIPFLQQMEISTSLFIF
jgi:hypothetical protein